LCGQRLHGPAQPLSLTQCSLGPSFGVFCVVVTIGAAPCSIRAVSAWCCPSLPCAHVIWGPSFDLSLCAHFLRVVCAACDLSVAWRSRWCALGESQSVVISRSVHAHPVSCGSVPHSTHKHLVVLSDNVSSLEVEDSPICRAAWCAPCRAACRFVSGTCCMAGGLF
jgi:hypothetical protein